MLSLIAAVALNRVIGCQGRLPWQLPADMAHFKSLTMGHTIIMGRCTYDSLPHGALPHRRNIVLTRSRKAIEGCDCYASLEEALNHCTEEEEVFVIGGASVYRQAMDRADVLNLTEIDDLPEEADAFFPPYDDWEEVWRENHPTDERHKQAYAFVDYVRRKAE